MQVLVLFAALLNSAFSLHVLVTGGAGFIGSHTAVELLEQGHEVTIMDNLENSKASVIDRIHYITGKPVKFYEVDCGNRTLISRIFDHEKFDAVIHMAGYKAVGESVEKPLKYYQNNLRSTLAILYEMKAHNVNKFIFSSSATVYGSAIIPGCTEDLPSGQGLTNPYGKTKYMIEEILKDYAIANPEAEITILRYFNPIGCHSSGLLGEDPAAPPTNLMPVIMRVYEHELPELKIFGDDYDSPDGTCIRDYIHVVDLAKGHIAAMNRMKKGVLLYNLGTGRGTSVKEMVSIFEKVTGAPLNKKIVGRRPGDVGVVYANASKAERELHWKTELNVEDAVRDTLRFLEKRRVNFGNIPHQINPAHKFPDPSTSFTLSSSHVLLLVLLVVVLFVFCTRKPKQTIRSSSR